MEREMQVGVKCGLSWLAYFRPMIMSVFIVLVALLLAELAEEKLLAGAGLIVAVMWLLYKIAYLRSVSVFTNEKGVWVCQGLFPWQRGVVGVKWRDLDGAIYMTGFVSWMTRAYRVQIRHRYTKALELALDNVHNGHHFVGHINAELARYSEGYSSR